MSAELWPSFPLHDDLSRSPFAGFSSGPKLSSGLPPLSFFPTLPLAPRLPLSPRTDPDDTPRTEFGLTPTDLLETSSDSRGECETPREELLFTPRPSSPEAKARSLETPPSSPGLTRRRLNDDIAAAVESSSLACLLYSLQCGHRCNKDHYVLEAVRRQNVGALQFLLESDVEGCDMHCHGRRPIHEACQACITEGDVGYEMMKVLLKHGASPNRVDGDADDIDCPLHDMVRRGNSAGAALLLAYGADATGVDSTGDTVLHALARSFLVQCSPFQKEILALLLDHGASPLAPDAFGLIPSLCASSKKVQDALRKAESWKQRVDFQVAVGKRAFGPPEQTLPRELVKDVATWL